MRGGGNGLLELPLRSAVVLASFRNARAQLVGARRIDLVELRGDGLGLVHAAADDSGRFLVKVAQIRECLGIARIELDGGFKLSRARACPAKMRS